jgi:hypothetical protein
MRRMLFVLSSVGLLGAALGCHCTQGVCDCDYTPWGTPIVPVNPGHAGAASAAVGGATYAPALAVPTTLPNGAKAEPIKEMPKPDSKPTGEGVKTPKPDKE